MSRHSLALAAGFTLIEVIGAFFMTIVILIFVTGIFVENGRQRDAATDLMRVQTSAAGALDLIAQDLESAVFISPPANLPPGDHPWHFFADRAGEAGATFLRFQTQNVPGDRLGQHASTWVEVVYFLSEEEEPEHFTLWRWRSTRPPSEPGGPDPDPSDPRSARVIEGLSDFGVTFLDADGGSTDAWDSAIAPRDTPLPIGADIQLTLYKTAREGESLDGELEIPGNPHLRPVSLRMHQPIDVDQLIELALAGQTAGGCETIDDCRDLGPDDDWYLDAADDCSGVSSDLCDALLSPGTTCWADLFDLSTAIADTAPADCDAFL